MGEKKIMIRSDLKRIMAENFPKLKKGVCSQVVLKKNKVREITNQMSRYIAKL